MVLEHVAIETDIQNSIVMPLHFQTATPKGEHTPNMQPDRMI